MPGLRERTSHAEIMGEACRASGKRDGEMPGIVSAKGGGFTSTGFGAG